MKALLTFLAFILQLTLLCAKICQVKKFVTKPVRQSYLENVRKTVTYPCCTNIICDPPVCTKVAYYIFMTS